MEPLPTTLKPRTPASEKKATREELYALRTQLYEPLKAVLDRVPAPARLPIKTIEQVALMLGVPMPSRCTRTQLLTVLTGILRTMGWQRGNYQRENQWLKGDAYGHGHPTYILDGANLVAKGTPHPAYTTDAPSTEQLFRQ